jgi:hypothetical protein
MIIHHTLKPSNDFARKMGVSGEVIEDYPDDQPYPSCLVFGRTQSGGPLHVVRWIDFHLFWQQCWPVSCGSAR